MAHPARHNNPGRVRVGSRFVKSRIIAFQRLHSTVGDRPPELVNRLDRVVVYIHDRAHGLDPEIHRRCSLRSGHMQS